MMSVATFATYGLPLIAVAAGVISLVFTRHRASRIDGRPEAEKQRAAG